MREFISSYHVHPLVRLLERGTTVKPLVRLTLPITCNVEFWDVVTSEVLNPYVLLGLSCYDVGLTVPVNSSEIETRI